MAFVGRAYSEDKPEEFPWPLFLQAILTPQCNSANIDKCKTIADCFYNGLYWYNNSCHINDSSIPQSNRTHLLVDGKLHLYKPGNKIHYSGALSGTTEYEQYGICYDIPVTAVGTGDMYISDSPWNQSNMPPAPPPNTIPPLYRQLTIFNIQGYTSSSSYNFNQDHNGQLRIYIDDEGYYYNYPHGIITTESPLFVGKTWTYDVDPLEYWKSLYSSGEEYYESDERGSTLKGNYTVVGKDIITIGQQKYETFKIYYTAYNGGSWESSNESGYLWIYPKIGIIKGQASINYYQFGKCNDSLLKLNYWLDGANFIPKNLPYSLNQ